MSIRRMLNNYAIKGNIQLAPSSLSEVSTKSIDCRDCLTAFHRFRAVNELDPHYRVGHDVRQISLASGRCRETIIDDAFIEDQGEVLDHYESNGILEVSQLEATYAIRYGNPVSDETSQSSKRQRLDPPQVSVGWRLPNEDIAQACSSSSVRSHSQADITPTVVRIQDENRLPIVSDLFPVNTTVVNSVVITNPTYMEKVVENAYQLHSSAIVRIFKRFRPEEYNTMTLSERDFSVLVPAGTLKISGSETELRDLNMRTRIPVGGKVHLIVAPPGSGKSTLNRKVYGNLLDTDLLPRDVSLDEISILKGHTIVTSRYDWIEEAIVHPDFIVTGFLPFTQQGFSRFSARTLRTTMRNKVDKWKSLLYLFRQTHHLIISYERDCFLAQVIGKQIHIHSCYGSGAAQKY